MDEEYIGHTGHTMDEGRAGAAMDKGPPWTRDTPWTSGTPWMSGMAWTSDAVWMSSTAWTSGMVWTRGAMWMRGADKPRGVVWTRAWASDEQQEHDMGERHWPANGHVMDVLWT